MVGFDFAAKAGTKERREKRKRKKRAVFIKSLQKRKNEQIPLQGKLILGYHIYKV
jgi:hypothetical protein